jgi:hypothetical protein
MARICILPDPAHVKRLEQAGGRRPTHPSRVTRDWKSSPTSWWAHFYAARSLCGRKVGTRKLGKKRVTVVEVGGRFYATSKRTKRY